MNRTTAQHTQHPARCTDCPRQCNLKRQNPSTRPAAAVRGLVSWAGCARLLGDRRLARRAVWMRQQGRSIDLCLFDAPVDPGYQYSAGPRDRGLDVAIITRSIYRRRDSPDNANETRGDMGAPSFLLRGPGTLELVAVLTNFFVFGHLFAFASINSK